MSSALIMAVVSSAPIASDLAANHTRIKLLATAYVRWVLSVYPISAKLSRRMRASNLPRKTCLSSVEFLLRSGGCQSYSVRVAQSLGGEFTKEEAIIPSQAAEVPNAEPGGDLGDSSYRAIRIR